MSTKKRKFLKKINKKAFLKSPQKGVHLLSKCYALREFEYRNLYAKREDAPLGHLLFLVETGRL